MPFPVTRVNTLNHLYNICEALGITIWLFRLKTGFHIGDYLRFVRLDSASASIAYSLLGFTLAGGALLSWKAVVWAIFGLLFHAAGYADNNLQDYSHDQKDANKARFPLGRTLNLSSARAFTVLLHATLLVSAALLARSMVPLIGFVAIYSFGLAYNRKSKSSGFAPLLFAMTFSPLAVFSFYSFKGEITSVILAVSSLAFFECLFQNAVSTSVKDIENDPVSSMKSLGVQLVGDTLKFPPSAAVFSFGLKVLVLVPLVYLFNFAPLFAELAAIPFLAIALIYSIVMLRTGPWERSKRMLVAAVSELGVYYSVIVLFSFELGAFWAIFMIFFPLVWYVAVKKALWGRVLELMA